MINMIILDVNLLIYSFRAEFSEHQPAREWLFGALGGTEPVGLHSMVLCGFLRLNTKALGSLPPAPMERALDFLDALRGFPQAVPVHEGAGHSSIFRQLSRRHGTTGDHVNDAWLAALALEKRAVLASADRGFGRFTTLRWINPLQGPTAERRG